jgi:glycosyltransferase involved in cell wall biosynthesis
MTKPLVSIVTPTLNQGTFIEQTLQSMEAQSYQRFEHIVVDGGSTDGTLDILRRYQGRYALNWQSGPDGGMYEAINKGLRQARGEIVAYLNSDDLYFPWTLAVVVAAFERHRDAGFVYGDLLQIDEGCRCERIAWQLPYATDFVRRWGVLAQPTIFWRRSVLAQEGYFDEGLRYVADCDYWMRAGVRQRFHKVNEFLAVDRVQAGAYRATAAEGVRAELMRVRARYVDLSGPQHHVRTGLHRARFGLIRRFYSLAFLGQSLLPPRLRARPWAMFLAQPGVRVDRLAGAAALIPRVGTRFQDRVTRSPRRWASTTE